MSEVFRSYINSVRRDFADQPLTFESVGDDPYAFFENWFDEAVGSEVLDPYAMHLATVNSDFQPGVCVVYMRDISTDGLVFYTNYNSRKGSDLKAHSKASANFFWVELDRQIRFSGRVEKVSDATSDLYFAQRPRPSQIGAWASEQSTEIAGRKVLEDRVKIFEEKFKDQAVPRPPHWGGYLLKPNRIEFWQGRPSRLHDRIVFTRTETDRWEKHRLAP